MKIELSGSCHCKAVTFTVQSSEPIPFNLCYCSICRKTSGAGGFAINLGAEFETLKIQGRDNIGTYQARIPDKKPVNSSKAKPNGVFAKNAVAPSGFGVRSGLNICTRMPPRSIPICPNHLKNGT